MKKRKILSLVTALCLALGLTACGGGTDETAAKDSGSDDTASGDSVITIGMIGPLTGSLAVYGTHNERGVELAIEEINAAGGVTLSDGTYQLAVDTRDDQGDSTECVNAMNALISDGIQLVIGSATSARTPAITPIANPEGAARSTPVYCSADTYSSGLRDAFSAACAEKGIEVVAEESVATMTEVDYTNQFNQMVSAGAELVFTPFYYDVMGPYLIPQARSVGFDGVLLGADGVDNTETTIPDGADLSAYNNVMFVNHYSTELATSDVSINFVESYEAKYGESPNNFDALAYDAVYVLKDAMEDCGAADAASVQASLADTSKVYEVSTGTFSFDETGTPIKSGVLMGYQYDEATDSVQKISIETLSVN